MSNLVSKQQINKAKEFNMVALLDYFGFQPCEQRGNELVYFSPFRYEKTPSFFVNVKGNVCKDFGDNENSGDVLRLYGRITGKTFLTCVHDLLKNKINVGTGETIQYQTIITKDKKQAEIIEIKDRITNKNLIHYLESRCINPETANLYCKEIHYKQPNGKVYYGIGFPNNSGGFEVRSANFKSCFGTKDITIIEYFSNKIHVFEGFFDFLSFQELSRLKKIELKNDFVILNSTSLISRLNFLSKYKQINTYLDNDDSGSKASNNIYKSYLNQTFNGQFIDKSFGYKTDLNDFLIEKLSK
jgi:hypothetical protein